MPGLGNLQAILETAQQQLMAQMEAKIAEAMNAKLSMLSQRLAFSEQQIFALHQRIDSSDGESKARVDDLHEKLVALESQMSVLAGESDRSKLKDPTSE